MNEQADKKSKRARGSQSRLFGLPGRLIGLVLIVLGVGWLLQQGLGQIEGLQEQAQSTAPISLPPPPEIDPGFIRTLLEPDAIRAIDEPLFVPVAEAIHELEPDERVIGVVINGEARAYPIPIMSAHEIVNDVVGGEPVAITWCPLCYTALVFSRRVAGQLEPLSFGVSGKLLHNTLVMYDRQTQTLWSQLYGAAVDGDLAGQTLAVFPSTHTAWSAWLATYPDSLVLSKSQTCEQFNCGTYSTNPRGSYDVDPYASYYNTPLEGVIDYQIPRDDFSPSPKERLLGIRVGGGAKAYLFRLLERTPVVNDELQGLPLVVWFDPETQTGLAYQRTVEGRILTLQADPNALDFLVDVETGTRWQAVTGRAIAGPLKGKQLSPLVATPAFEFGWFAYFPESASYQP